jgi:molybdopterin converting factor small subunit
VSVTLRVPTILRPLTGGETELAVDGVSTLAELVDKVDAEHPGIRDRVLDENGKIRRFVNVYVGEEDVRFAGGLDTPTPDGVTVSIIPAVAGGSEVTNRDGGLPGGTRGPAGSPTVVAVGRARQLLM